LAGLRPLVLTRPTVFTPGSAILAAPAWRASARWFWPGPPGLALMA